MSDQLIIPHVIATCYYTGYRKELRFVCWDVVWVEHNNGFANARRLMCGSDWAYAVRAARRVFDEQWSLRPIARGEM